MEKICLVKLRKKIINPVRSQGEQGVMSQERVQVIPQQFTSSFTNRDIINKAVSHNQGRDEELRRQFISSFVEQDIISKAVSDNPGGDEGLTRQFVSSFANKGLLNEAVSDSQEREPGGARQFIAPCADNDIMLHNKITQNITSDADKKTVPGETVCLTLTQEQIKTIRSSSGLQSVFNGELAGRQAELNYRDQPITIKFACEPLAPVRLLMTEEVTQMLRISSGFLKTIVRDGKLKSYKVGKGRRYMLEDILAYLAENLNSHGSQQETLRAETL